MRLNLAAKVGLIAAFAAVLALGGAMGVALAHDQSTYDVIPQNTYIEGVDVSGMTADEARDALASRAQAQADTITLNLVDEQGVTHAVSLANAVSYDVDAAVEAAVQRNHDRAAISRILDDATGSEPERADIALAASVDTSSLYDQVSALAAEIDCEPADAYRDFNDDDTVTLHQEVWGRSLDVDASVAAAVEAVNAAVGAGTSLSDLAASPIAAQLTVYTTAPSVAVADLPPCIIVDYDNTTLYVFGSGSADVIFTCPFGYGRGTDENGTFTSPEGLHYIEYKDAAPTWTNPDPDGWGKDYELYYEAGPDNPLGLRAMKISDASMVYIHGVSDYSLVHNNMSHGCINVYNDDVVQLFDLIPEPSEVSTPIYVYFHGTQATYPGGAVEAYYASLGY